jgi:hypothetical protein
VDDEDAQVEKKLAVQNPAPYKQLPFTSMISLGLRRGLCNASACDVAKVLMLDVSRQRICSAEVKAANAITLVARQFHDLLFSKLGIDIATFATLKRTLFAGCS